MVPEGHMRAAFSQSESGRRVAAPGDCPRRIFLPVNDGRMVAVNADTGPCLLGLHGGDFGNSRFMR